MPDHESLQPRTAGPLVLVVADDPAPLSIITRMVRTLGYRVRSCPTSADALAFLREHPRDVGLLLTDLALRGIDGYALAERARDLAPGLHVVLMVTLTGPHIDELIDQIPFVAKPVHFGELAGVLHDLLGQPADAPSDPPSITRPRRRRTSGHHEV
jgi:two-component system, NarL family, capsular synthesis sensor histidine kinase RcsC